MISPAILKKMVKLVVLIFIDATRIKPELNQHSHLDIFNQKVKVLNDLGLISDQAHLNYQNQLTSEAFLSWLDYWSKQGERCNYSY